MQLQQSRSGCCGVPMRVADKPGWAQSAPQFQPDPDRPRHSACRAEFEVNTDGNVDLAADADVENTVLLNVKLLQGHAQGGRGGGCKLLQAKAGRSSILLARAPAQRAVLR